jgi:pyrimidine deaminase RibD-like protein
MDLALREAAKCKPTPSAFCVGAVIVKSTSPSHPEPLSAGYSRELEGNTHAEQCAIDKLVAEKGEASAKEALHGADMYTTMEPCSVRLSGNKPCTDRILEYGIARVYLGTMEPDEFVKCEGVRILQDKGVQVYNVPGFAEKCLQEARRGR